MATISSQTAAAREAARRRNGEFGEQNLADPGSDVLGGIPLSDREPSDIDAELAELMYESYRLTDRRAMYAEELHRFAGDKKHYRHSRSGSWTMSTPEAVEQARSKLDALPGDDYFSRSTRSSLAKYDEITARLETIKAQSDVLETEYRRRGGWNREFIVQNADGHSHTSMGCPTCNKGRSATRFAWMTEFSGKDKYELLEAAGWRICDVCHPLDPNDDQDPRNRPDWADPSRRGTSMYTQDDLDREKARQEREAARIARAQKKLAGSPTCDGQPLRIDKGWSTEQFTSERSALIWATDHLADVAQKAERPDLFQPHMDERHARANTSLETLLDTVALKRVAAAHQVLGVGPNDVFGAVAYSRGVEEAAITDELHAELAEVRAGLKAELEAKGAAKWARTKRSWGLGR